MLSVWVSISLICKQELNKCPFYKVISRTKLQSDDENPCFLCFVSIYLFVCMRDFCCGRQARCFSCPSACGILVLQSGMEPKSPALESRFLTTVLPGRSLKFFVNWFIFPSPLLSKPREHKESLKMSTNILSSESESHSVVSSSLRLHGLYSPRNSPGQNTGVGSCSLLKGIFPTQGSKPGLLHCRWIL